MNLSLEITEKEYLIKLNKQQFDVSLIRNLLKIVEISKPNDFQDEGCKNQETYFEFREGYFGHLDEK
jgi:hypothetical protein